VQATLQILTGPETGRRILLKSGQVASFGRTEWSDFSFPYDHRLADVHFSIETSDAAVTLADLSGGQGVQIDGEKLTTCQLRSGQKIKAGNMIFGVGTEVLFDTSNAGPVSVARPIEQQAAPELARKVCESVELSEPAGNILDDSIEVLPFIDQLTGAELLVDAMRVLATWLGKRKAVWWGTDCVDSACADRLDAQAGLIALARSWVRDPTEENRRSALDAAETADTKLPGCWLARAAGWSGGSLSPPGLPVVPPDERLTAQSLTGALLLAAVFIDPAQCAGNYRKFIAMGKQLAITKLDWEEG
jgi:pSer/pThr/pTyr-binding forkhead associated (FHA) protein